MVRPFVVASGILAASVLAFASAPAQPVGVYPRQDPQTPPRQATEVAVSLSNPGSHPKVGFQAFATSTAAQADAAATIGAVLAADLDFEREFYVISRQASAGIPPASTPQALPFAQWTGLGADFVLMGTLRETAGKLEVDVKLINVRPAFAGREDFKQTYNGCTLATARFCAHAIADDMHRQLRNLDGVARTRIAYTSDADAESATGRPIDNTGLGKEIHYMDYDGALDQRVTRNRRLNIAPVWGSDGRTLAYAGYASGFPDIYLVTGDGRPASRPAQGTESITNTLPAISPDGTKIAFTSTRGGSSGYYDVWIMNRDGSDLHNVTPGTDKWNEVAVTWSPDGRQLAFTSDRTGVNQIYIMNADGTNVTRKTFSTKADRPSWSRLNYIAYTLERGGGHDIAIIDLSKGEPRILTDGLGSYRQPTVSPNGRHIAFVTTRWGGREQIATIDYPDGKNIRQLTTAGSNTYPNWSPTPGGR